jgi:hypothetical protein
MWRDNGMNRVDSFTYLACIISKDNGCSEHVKSTKAKVQCVFYSWKTFGKIGR